MTQVATIDRQALPGMVIRTVLAVGLITLSAKIKVPFYPVPMTLQVAAILLVAGLGGLRLGLAAMLGYLAAGAAGMPVFAGTPEKGIGLAYMAGPTGGYLLGFLVAAALVGGAVARFGKGAAFWSMPVSLGIIYILGVAWLAQFVPGDKVLAYGVLPFWMGDLCKVALAALLVFMTPPALKKLVRG
jgi:biotin transport system substrate-specific component